MGLTIQQCTRKYVVQEKEFIVQIQQIFNLVSSNGKFQGRNRHHPFIEMCRLPWVHTKNCGRFQSTTTPDSAYRVKVKESEHFRNLDKLNDRIFRCQECWTN